MTFPINFFNFGHLFTGWNFSSFVPQSVEVVAKRFFESTLSVGFQAMKRHPVYTLGGAAVFTGIAVLSYRVLIRQRYPETREESFRVLQNEALEGKDIQKRVKGDPHLASLKCFIEHFLKKEARKENGMTTRYTQISEIRHHALYVLFGIKPALALNMKELDQEDFVMIEGLAKMNPSCRAIRDGDYFYFLNESPQSLFDPRKYILPEEFAKYGDSISEAVKASFPYNHSLNEPFEQFLSYLLGFGPSWEDYMQRNKKSTLSSISIFSDEHYRQLGAASGEEDPEKFVEAGKLESKREKSQHDFSSSADSYHILNELYMSCYFSNTTAETSYYRDSIYYRGRIELAFYQLFKQEIKRLGQPDTLEVHLCTMNAIKANHP